MEKNKLNLTVASVFASALAAVVGSSNSSDNIQNEMQAENNSISISKKDRKPVTVLKLNTTNPEDSKLIAQHRSHSSHSSHSSHYSHRSSSFA